MQGEVIPFVAKSIVKISWDESRLDRFGIFPVLEVWLTVNGQNSKVDIPVTADAQPPATKELTINFGALVTGFIVIK